LSYWGVNYWQL